MEELNTDALGASTEVSPAASTPPQNAGKPVHEAYLNTPPLEPAASPGLGPSGVSIELTATKQRLEYEADSESLFRTGGEGARRFPALQTFCEVQAAPCGPA